MPALALLAQVDAPDPTPPPPSAPALPTGGCSDCPARSATVAPPGPSRRRLAGAPGSLASVRVGPSVGATTCPVTTSRLRMTVHVPCRMYSNSRRSTLPGASGKPGCLRSSAWMPVSSSVVTMRSPWGASAGAARYRPQMSATLPSNWASSGGVSHERTRCGWRSPFEQARGVAGRDLLDDAALDDFVGQFATSPLADGALRVGRRLTGQGDDLGDLLGGDADGRAGAGRIGQAISHGQVLQGGGLQDQPAGAPAARHIKTDVEQARKLAIIGAVGGSETMAGRIRVLARFFAFLRGAIRSRPRRSRLQQPRQPPRALRPRQPLRRHPPRPRPPYATASGTRRPGRPA